MKDLRKRIEELEREVRYLEGQLRDAHKAITSRNIALHELRKKLIAAGSDAHGQHIDKAIK